MRWLLFALVAAGCGDDDDAPQPEIEPPAGLLAPSDADDGRPCTDVATFRACWGDGAGECVESVCLVDRPLPQLPEPGGYRCGGSGDERRCAPRDRGVGRFRCSGDTCVQHHPRFPDQGQWECTEAHGATSCRHLGDAAGVPAGEIDPSFVCGERRGTGETICVDFSPDFPEANPFVWRCRWVNETPRRRICDRNEELPRIGATCNESRRCPAGAYCVDNRCVPRELEPDCWIDEDCGEDVRCRFGSCAG